MKNLNFLLLYGVLLSGTLTAHAQSDWEALGGAVGNAGLGRKANVIVLDAGGIRYVGGTFRSAGGQVVNHVAKWQHGAWQPLGTGVEREVKSLAVVNEAAAYVALAGGITPDEVDILRWDGQVWTPLATRARINPDGLQIDAEGGLLAFGEFRMPETDSRITGIHRWKDGVWTHSPNLPGGGSPIAYALAPDGTYYISTNWKTLYVLYPGASDWVEVDLPKREKASMLFVDAEGTLYADGPKLTESLSRYRNGTWERFGPSCHIYQMVLGADGYLYTYGYFGWGTGLQIRRIKGDEWEVVWQLSPFDFTDVVSDFVVDSMGTVTVVSPYESINGIPIVYAVEQGPNGLTSLGIRMPLPVGLVHAGMEGEVTIGGVPSLDAQQNNIYRLRNGTWEALGSYQATSYLGQNYPYSLTTRLATNGQGQLVAVVRPAPEVNNPDSSVPQASFLQAWDGTTWRTSATLPGSPLLAPFGSVTAYAHVYNMPTLARIGQAESGIATSVEPLVGVDQSYVAGAIRELQNVNGTLWAAGNLFFSNAFVNQPMMVVRWSGQTWQPFPALPSLGATGPFYRGFAILPEERAALAVHVVGTGTEVYVGDETQWDRIGLFAVDQMKLAATPDGTLFASGTFVNGRRVEYLYWWKGTVWEAVPSGPDGPISSMVVGPDGYLYLAGDFETVGGIASPGVARWGGGRSVATDPVRPASPTLSLSSYPNPFTTQATVRYSMPEAGAVRLAVYDVLGREVAVLADAVQPSGVYEVPVTSAGLAAGVYLARLAVGGQQQTLRLTVAR